MSVILTVKDNKKENQQRNASLYKWSTTKKKLSFLICFKLCSLNARVDQMRTREQVPQFFQQDDYNFSLHSLIRSTVNCKEMWRFNVG